MKFLLIDSWHKTLTDWHLTWNAQQMFVKCFETGYTRLQRLKSYFFLFIVQWYGPGPFCFTTTEARLLIRDGVGGGRGGGRESEGSTADTALKRPERPWTAARTMEVLRRCPLAIAQRLVHCAIAVWTAVLGRVTMSVALLLRNNPKRKKSYFRSPAPPPCS